MTKPGGSRYPTPPSAPSGPSSAPLLVLHLGPPPPRMNAQQRMHWAALAKLHRTWRQRVLASALTWLHGRPMPRADKPHIRRHMHVVWQAPQLPDGIDNAMGSLKGTVTDNLRYMRYKRTRARPGETKEDGTPRSWHIRHAPSHVCVIYDDDPEHLTHGLELVKGSPRRLTVTIYEATTEAIDGITRKD